MSDRMARPAWNCGRSYREHCLIYPGEPCQTHNQGSQERLAKTEARRILDEQEGRSWRMTDPGKDGRTIDADGYGWWQPEAVGLATWALRESLAKAVADGQDFAAYLRHQVS